MLQVAFAGTFSATLEPSVRARLTMPCDVVMGDETGIVSRLGDVDVLVTLAFNREMAAAAKNLKLVQVPGAGLDRIDRPALPAGASLANVYGHEVGIAEYVLGAMLALTRSFCRIDASLRRGVWESQWGVGGSPRERRSAFWATVGSDRPSRGAPGRSTWTCARSGAT